MGPALLIMAVCILVGVVINWLLSHRPSPFLLRFGAFALAVGLLPQFFGLFSPQDGFLATLIILCTGFIIQEIRNAGKKDSD